MNIGFSGGEKKKAEILQMLMLRPALAILDETDSGLDVDAVRTVSRLSLIHIFVFALCIFILSRLAGYYGIIASQAAADVLTAVIAVILYMQTQIAEKKLSLP